MRRILSIGMTLVFVLLMAVSAAASGITVQLNGEVLTGADPIMEGGRVLVPLRKLSEALGFDVAFLEESNQIKLAGRTGTVVLTVDSNTALVNGVEKTLDVPVMVRDGRSYVPVRFVSENLGAQVAWDDATQTVSVTASTTASDLALLERAMTASANAQSMDQKLVGTIKMKMTMDMQGMEITMEMPMSIEIHTHKGEMLTKMTMTIPGPMGQMQMETMSALKDGVMYSMDPISGTWMVIGEIGEDGLPDLSSLAVPGLEGLLTLQQDLLKNAKVVNGGSHVVNGVDTTRLDVDLDPAAFNKLFGDLFTAMGLPEGDSVDIEITQLNLSLYVDPVTAHTSRTDMTMAVIIDIQAQGEIGSIKMNAKATIDSIPGSQPIVWPEMEIMEPVTWPLPGWEVEAEEVEAETVEAVEAVEAKDVKTEEAAPATGN